MLVFTLKNVERSGSNTFTAVAVCAHCGMVLARAISSKDENAALQIVINDCCIEYEYERERLERRNENLEVEITLGKPAEEIVVDLFKKQRKCQIAGDAECTPEDCKGCKSLYCGLAGA